VFVACGGNTPNEPEASSGTSSVPSAGAGSGNVAGGPAGGAGAGGAGAGGAGTNAGGSASGGSSSAGAVSGGAGSGGAGALGGAGAGTGGAVAGTAGTATGGSGGAAGAGGQNGGGGAGAGGAGGKSFTCPAGPFSAPSVVSSKTACQGFNLEYSWNEGPTWVESQGAFFFSNFVAGSASGGNIVKYTPGGNCEVFIRDVGCNGLAASNDGNLLAACQQTRSVQRFDLKTKQATKVADSYMGKMLDTPNDVVQHSNGSVYFTNPTNELAGRPVGVGPAAFRVDPSGVVSMIKAGNCNGIGLSPDEKSLYVLLLGRWDLDAQGAPSNERSMFTTGDGMAVDCAGNVYANGNIFSSTGQNLGSWGTGTNLAFGGADHKTVLVTGPGKQLRELTLNVPGLP
jgi:sugar lactone lactonase YvrE